MLFQRSLCCNPTLVDVLFFMSCNAVPVFVFGALYWFWHRSLSRGIFTAGFDIGFGPLSSIENGTYISSSKIHHDSKLEFGAFKDILVIEKS